MEKKNTLLLTVIAVATLLVAVVGATFAYFGSFSTDNIQSANVNVTTQAGQSVVFQTTGEELKYVVPGNKMGAGSGTGLEEAGKGTGSLTVSLSAGTDQATTTCTYDVYYESKLKYEQIVENEFTYTLTAPATAEGSFTVGADRETKGIITSTPKSMTGLQTGGKVMIATTETIISSSVTPTTVKYDLASTFYNMPSQNQDALASKEFTGALTVENVRCSTVAKSN